MRSYKEYLRDHDKFEKDINERGTGRTTAQMKSAPRNSVFIWCNQHIDYPKKDLPEKLAGKTWKSFVHHGFGMIDGVGLN